LQARDNAREPALTGRRHRFEMPVRWGDLDTLNHVNNTVYFRYMEEARVHALRAAGIGVARDIRNIVLAHTACDFLKPITWPATLLIDQEIVRVGRSSMESVTEIHVAGDAGGPCMRARNVIVGIDPRTGRSSPWTPAELEGLAKVFVAPTA
jgi:acyl-CoA thioester hydrolase